MHTTHCHLINGSLEPKDVVFLISLETADRCRKYGVTLLRRILLCAICSFYPGQKEHSIFSLERHWYFGCAHPAALTHTVHPDSMVL